MYKAEIIYCTVNVEEKFRLYRTVRSPTSTDRCKTLYRYIIEIIEG
jgi:hypothetical protein